MEKTVVQGVPKPIYVIIVATLVAMFSYAIFIETAPAEKTVEDFYQAYFTKDYDQVAEHLSVFWAVQFLPHYHNLSPGELIENRATIEKEIAQVIREIEGDTSYPEDLAIKVDSSLTKEEEYSALVGYTFEEGEEALGMEVAILINEDGAYRIYSMSPATPEDVRSISDDNMKNLDTNFKTLLELE